jgi:hypothetical protein
MANPHQEKAPSRFRVLGPENLLRRIRDIVEHGRIDVAHLRIGNVVGWLLSLARSADVQPGLGDICVVLESAARLLLLKARRLAGSWEPPQEETFAPWGGPPPELPLRRSWLAERVAAGPLSFPAPPRTQDDLAPLLMPIAPERLRAAMLAVLARAKPPRLRIVPLPRPVRISVEACCSLILERLGRGREIRFADVAAEGRDGRVAAFLACLILARQGRVELRQDVLFSDIVLRPASEAFEATA